jgi:hypothetical protein
VANEWSSGKIVLAGLLIALGLAAAGYLIGDGLYEARASERYVTVKGLSERVVPADLVIWPIVFTVTADDLETLQRRIDESAAKIVRFLEPDFEADEHSLSVPRVTDYSLQAYAPGTRPPMRYAGEVTLTLRTSKIGPAREAMRRSGELVKAGVPLLRSYEHQTQFLFTDLERIKPEMIAEATQDARRAAEQFAEDSGSKVGSIRTAQQGYFSIEDRDPYSPEFKKVRVVTTVQYFLLGD